MTDIMWMVIFKEEKPPSSALFIFQGYSKTKGEKFSIYLSTGKIRNIIVLLSKAL